MQALCVVGPVQTRGGNVFGFAIRDIIAFIVGCLIKLLG